MPAHKDGPEAVSQLPTRPTLTVMKRRTRQSNMQQPERVNASKPNSPELRLLCAAGPKELLADRRRQPRSYEVVRGRLVARRIAAPTAPKPSSIIAHVDGSGTGRI